MTSNVHEVTYGFASLGVNYRNEQQLRRKAEFAFNEAVKRGAIAFEEPHDETDAHGSIRRASIKTYGDTIHSLISYKDYKGPFLPGFVEARIQGKDAGILRVDHMVGNVELGK